MNKAWFIILSIFVMAVAAGCETVKGVGKDLQNTGEYVQRGMSR